MFNVTFQDGTVINAHMDTSVYELAKLQAKYGAIKSIEAVDPVRQPRRFYVGTNIEIDPDTDFD